MRHRNSEVLNSYRDPSSEGFICYCGFFFGRRRDLNAYVSPARSVACPAGKETTLRVL